MSSRDLGNADLAQALQLPVILVVGMRLGCINHARLTGHAIKQSGLMPVGWLAVQLQSDMSGFQANLDYLQDHLQSPCLGVLPHLTRPDFDLLSGCVNVQN